MITLFRFYLITVLYVSFSPCFSFPKNFAISIQDGILSPSTLQSDKKNPSYLFDRRLTNVESLFDLNLGGTWKAMNANQSVVVNGEVPGNIHTDLLRSGILSQDPYYRFNDGLYRWIGLENWTYTRMFRLSTEMASRKRILLICEGLDTVAYVNINGHPIGTTNNMFRRYRFDITGLVQAGENSIGVAFTSAATYASRQHISYPYPVPSSDSPVQHGELYRNFIRKEQCSFSWDWGPCFIPQGIWQPIGITAFSTARIIYVTVQTFPRNDETNAFSVVINTFVETVDSMEVFLDISVAGFFSSKNFTLISGENQLQSTMNVQGVDLWWPNGYGKQFLYNLSVSLYDFYENQIDTEYRTIGFRTVELITKPIDGELGASFYFQVNGVPIFAKGSNWIPADSFENRVTYDVLQNLLTSAADANMNIIRNWGGGIYQHDAFYTLCDQLGLMVWQEFMFACAMYPRDQPFLENVHHEVIHQVRRIMHHPSIVLWSGNNENEVSLWLYSETVANQPLYTTDYTKLYFDTVREALILEDISRPFWPSSPSNGILVEDPFVAIWGNVGNQSIGDIHFYNYDMMCTNVSKLPSPRFASEYGFQSLDSLYTWLDVSDPSDWERNSSLMQWRQHHEGGQQQLVEEVKMHFRLNAASNRTKAFQDWIYLTQCMQALCMQVQTEHYRRGRGEQAQTMGAIYWQLNSIWQAPSWSSLEYGGRWKLLHYFAKRFFEPVLVSSVEHPSDQYSVYIVSDLMQPLSGSVLISLWTWKGVNLANWTIPFSIKALESKSIFTNQISQMISNKCSRSECFFALNAVRSDDNTLLSSNYFYLASFAEVELLDPHIKVISVIQTDAITAVITLQSQYPAPFVSISTYLDGRFSDNGILLLPGVMVKITFYGWKPFNQSQLQDSLSITSIRDTYA